MYRVKYYSKSTDEWFTTGIMDRVSATVLLDSLNKDSKASMFVDSEYVVCKNCVNMKNRKCTLTGAKVSMYDSCELFDIDREI